MSRWALALRTINSNVFHAPLDGESCRRGNRLKSVSFSRQTEPASFPPRQGSWREGVLTPSLWRWGKQSPAGDSGSEELPHHPLPTLPSQFVPLVFSLLSMSKPPRKMMVTVKGLGGGINCSPKHCQVLLPL